jgi:hypothetical protein
MCGVRITDVASLFRLIGHLFNDGNAGRVHMTWYVRIGRRADGAKDVGPSAHASVRPMQAPQGIQDENGGSYDPSQQFWSLTLASPPMTYLARPFPSALLLLPTRALIPAPATQGARVLEKR